MSKRANIPWERIEARLAEINRDQAWLRTTLGVEANVITNWKSRGAPSKEAVAIAQALDLSTDELLGLSAAPSSIPGAMRVVIADSGDPNFYDIPVVNVIVRAGITSFQTEHEEFDGATRSIPKKWVHQKKFIPEKLISMFVKGDSMDPRLCDGDSVVVNLADKAKQDGEVYVFNYGGEVVIKRLIRERGAWWLFSDNPDQIKYRQRGCADEHCEIIGRVVRRETDHI